MHRPLETLGAGVIIASEEYIRNAVAQGVRDGLRQALADAQRPANKRMNEAEASAYLGLAKATLRTWRCLKIGPKYAKAGRTVWYAVADLDDYLAKSEFHTTQSLTAPGRPAHETR